MHCFFFCSVYIYIHIKYKEYEVKALAALAWAKKKEKKIRCEVFQLVCVGEKNAAKCCSFGFGLVSW